MTLLKSEPTLQEQVAELATLTWQERQMWEHYINSLGTPKRDQAYKTWESIAKAQGDAEYQLFCSMRRANASEAKSGVFKAELADHKGEQFVRLTKNGELI